MQSMMDLHLGRMIDERTFFFEEKVVRKAVKRAKKKNAPEFRQPFMEWHLTMTTQRFMSHDQKTTDTALVIPTSSDLPK